MVAVLLVLLIAVVSTATLAARSTSGQGGALTLSAAREARDAAESGSTTIIGELNKPENRRLLVSGSSPNAWGSTTDVTQRNPCLNTTQTRRPLATASSIGNNTWKPAQVDPLGQKIGNGEYVLRKVRYANRNRSSQATFTYNNPTNSWTATTTTTPYNNNIAGNLDRDVNLNPVAAAGSENIGYLQLEVEGRVVRSNREVARATVIKEYEVIPKCCQRSFSGPASTTSSTLLNSFGNDQRICNESSANLGLLYGFNGGTLSVSGRNAGSVVEVDASGNPTGQNLKAVLCLTATGANCASPASTNPLPVAGGTVPVIPTVFNIDPPPAFGGTSTTAGVISAGGYYRVKSNLAGVERCTVNALAKGAAPGTARTLSSCADVNFCQRVTGSTVANYHCRMNRIRLTAGGDELILDTSRGTIALFFNEPGTSNNNGTVYVGGSSPLRHRYCTTPATGECTSVAPASAFTRLSFYGNQTYNNFTFLGGGETASIFIYFAQGTVQVGGNALAAGAIWTNDLQMNGSFTSAAPATNCATAADGFCYLTKGSVGSSDGITSAAVFDWVARSPVTTRVY